MRFMYVRIADEGREERGGGRIVAVCVAEGRLTRRPKGREYEWGGHIAR